MLASQPSHLQMRFDRVARALQGFRIGCLAFAVLHLQFDLGLVDQQHIAR